jgi:hypothetical protein
MAPFALERQSLYLSLHSVWQSAAIACQSKPKLSDIRIAPVIFRFIDFTSFGKAR